MLGTILTFTMLFSRTKNADFQPMVKRTKTSVYGTATFTDFVKTGFSYTKSRRGGRREAGPGIRFRGRLKVPKYGLSYENF